MSAHATLSPSARSRWGACPASVRECKKYPEPPSGAAAIDGTHSHTLLEMCIKNDLADPMIYKGQTLKDHEGEFVVKDDRIERVKFAIDYLRGRRDTLGICIIKAECKVDPRPIFGRDDLKGTVDVQIITDEFIEIVDYKDGMGVVDAKDNPQLDQYGWGVLAEYPMFAIPFKAIRFTIIQPKLREKGMTGISTHDQTIEQFMDGQQRLADQARATDDPNAPFVPGDTQCNYCKHGGACSARTGSALASAGISFENLDVVKQAADKEPSGMSDAQIVEIMDAAPLIRQMLEAVEAEALRRFEAGQSIAGLKVVRGSGRRAWSQDDEKIAAALKKFGLPKDVIHPVGLISPAQAEKATWEVTKNGEKVVKQLSEKQLKLLQSEYIKKSEGKLTVVSDSDGRPAVQLSAASMFGAVDSLEIPDFLKPL